MCRRQAYSFIILLVIVWFAAAAAGETGRRATAVRSLHSEEEPSGWCRYGSVPPPGESPACDRRETSLDYTLAVFYVVPTNVPFDESAYQRIVAATLNIQAWYQCATGGFTWRTAYPELVQVYYAEHTREYYLENGNWWGSLLGEMRANGLPIWSPGTVAAIWAHGAGWWAGAAQGCGGDCGVALLGVSLFPELNNPEYSGGECPGGVGVAAWPCTPEGAYAHELGHTLGLPHPSGDHAAHSIMSTHWNFPEYAPPSQQPWGFLTFELQSIYSNPFMNEAIDLYQFYPGCDVVNLPPDGPPPAADFSVETTYMTITLTNSSQGNVYDYWTFGDGGVSAAESPLHEYAQPGAYQVLLRVTNENAMMDLRQVTVYPESAPTVTNTPTTTVTPATTPPYTPTPTVTNTPALTPTSTGTITPTAAPAGGKGLAIMKREGVNDTNLYCYNGLARGDWSYWDAVSRNPSPLARDLWAVPAGNDATGMAAVEGNLCVLKRERAGDANLYLYNGLARGDWSYWDAVSRNPSPLARDLWAVPAGNDATGMAAVDITGDEMAELAIIKREGGRDMSLYYFNAPVPGDWTYWDAITRNPSPLARDLWVIPSGNDVAGLAGIDLDGGARELAVLRREGAGDLNLYYYRNLVTGDWTYWDAVSRNPSPLARDLWIISSGNDAVGAAVVEMDRDGEECLTLLKNEGAGDVNLYYYRGLVTGDWTYWDALSRNPSPLARDLWCAPSGNDAIGVTAIGTE